MGWTFHYGGPRKRAEVKAEITRMCTWDSEHYTARPVRIANHGNTWYIATRFTPKATGGYVPGATVYEAAPDGSHVGALIFLTKRDKGDWGYKEMDEFSGPCEATAPASILNVLSPLKGDGESTGYARKWRERCREHAETIKRRKRIKPGDRVRFAEPLRFRDGTEHAEFVATTYKKMGRWRSDGEGRMVKRLIDAIAFRPAGGGGLYRLGAGNLASAEIIPA